jgi:hypothetical protein
MNTAKGVTLEKGEYARRELLKLGVDTQFVSALEDNAATELLEGITRLLEMRRQQEE